MQESGVGTIYSHHQEHAIIDGGKSINRNGEGINNRHDQNRRDGHSNGVNIEFRHGQDMNSITKGAVSKNDNNYILAALRATQIIDPKAILPAGKSNLLATPCPFWKNRSQLLHDQLKAPMNRRWRSLRSTGAALSSCSLRFSLHRKSI